MRRYLIGLPFCFLFLAPFNDDQRRVPVPPSSSGGEERKTADDHKPLPSDEEMKRLAREDPIAFLENCLRRYQREVKGYTLLLEKQERINGELRKKEIIEVCFREEPHSVLMRWLDGARRASQALYVEGENDGMMLVRPNGRLLGRLIVAKDPEGEEARDSGRYTLKEFGLRKGTERVLKTWKAARDNGTLFVEYLGEERVKEAGDRVCHVLRRSRYQKPEADGVTEVTVYIDKETWLQVGSVLKGKDGELIASYFFRDIKLNPEFRPNPFRREALQR
jgi:hypothetical protein